MSFVVRMMEEVGRNGCASAPLVEAACEEMRALGLGISVLPEGEVLWTDYLSSLGSGKVPAQNAPTWGAFGPSGNLYAYKFAEGDYLYMEGFHINHDIKVGGKIYPHVHFSTSGTSTENVEWELEYVIAKGHDQEAFGAPETITLTQAGSSTAWQHQIVEATDQQALDAPEVDSLMLMRVKRTTTGNNTDDVFGLFVDLHVQIDRDGTLQKSPDFYAESE